MSERRSSAGLGIAADAALGAFPFPDRAWAEDVRAVQARLSEDTRGSTDASLLAAPLPSEPGEPTSPSATATPLSASGVRPQSFMDFARRSVQPTQSAEREMARASLALAAQRRPSPEQAAALREVVSLARSVGTVSSAPSTSAPAAPSQARPERNKVDRAWSKVGLGLGGVTLAAVILLWFRQPAAVPVMGRGIAPDPQQGAPLVQAPLARTGLNAEAPATPQPIDPSTLPEEGASKAADSPRALGGASALAQAARTAAPSSERAAAASTKTHSAADNTSDPSLPPDPALRPADSTSAAIPIRPSSGAAQAALGAVMSGARHCVAGDTDASSAVVVFSSDGHVQSVAVHGAAAGTPAAACIEGQLSRARVQPFAASTFSINASVRPD